MSGALVLVDGEHQPEVIEAQLTRLRASGPLPVAALFLGGFEKTGAVPRLSVPVLEGPARQAIPQAVERFDVTVVLDMSDEPIVDPRIRLTLAGYALAAGVPYSGGGIDLTPPHRPRLTRRPTAAVIGTGKRTGKTSVSIALARHWKEEGRRPCIVTMGRGGPDRPLVLSGEAGETPESVLDRLMEAGMHATSDYVEGSLFAGVDTVGTRRIGAGPAGVTVHDDFAAGVAAADALDPGVVLYEGSGTAIPPAYADATVLVVSSTIDPEFLTGYLGPFRLALADAVVLVGDETYLQAVIEQIEPGLPVFPSTLRPEPTIPVDGRAVVVASTADPSVGRHLSRHLRMLGAADVHVIHSLGDRRVLSDELSLLDSDHLLLTEVKGAAASVVLPLARAAGAEIGFIHNEIVMDGGIGGLAALLENHWVTGAQSTTSSTRRIGSRRMSRLTRS